MSYPRLAARLYNAPLFITLEKLDTIDHVFRAHEEGRAKLLTPYETKTRPEVAGPGEAQRMRSGYLRTFDGVAIISVLGTMVQRASGMDAESGLTSYADISAQLAAAMSDPQVYGILMEIDSQGGEVNGIFGLAEEIMAASLAKPIFAHANEEALSGGYLLGAAAEAFYTTRTGMVGSIGARVRHVDQSEYDAKRGFKYTDIVFGARKAELSPNAPLTDPARQFLQDHVNRSGEMFVKHVVDARGMTDKQVRGTEAALLHADEAAGIGAIDGIATISETMKRLQQRIVGAKPAFRGKRATAGVSGDWNADTSLSQEQIMQFANDAAKAEFEKATAEARAAGVTEGRAAAEAEFKKAAAAAPTKTDVPVDAAAVAKAAVETDRKRVVAIQSCEAAKGKPALASHLALETDMSVEQASALLAKAAVEVPGKPKNPLDAALAGTNPKVAASVASADDGAPAKTIDAADIYKRRRLAAVK